MTALTLSLAVRSLMCVKLNGDGNSTGLGRETIFFRGGLIERDSDVGTFGAG